MGLSEGKRGFPWGWCEGTRKGARAVPESGMRAGGILPLCSLQPHIVKASINASRRFPVMVHITIRVCLLGHASLGDAWTISVPLNPNFFA